MVQVKSQLCRKTPQYGPCSTNSACGCFHMVGTNDDAGVCGFLWPTFYRLVPCNSSGKPCQSNTICVRHPECDDRPLCYPVEMIDQTMCSPMQDYEFNRVMKWKKGAKEGSIVAGGNGIGNGLNQLVNPIGVIVDQLGQIYVADAANGRVVRWREGNDKGEIVVGGNGIGRGSNQLNHPTGLSFDIEGNLYVVDSANH
ncbi:unnamed protein product [Adineta steineri]|uniref:Uncharacterized protein n=1 Tax=Adineta steineri TaxID=433720 RepID=A0A819YAA9_9BILA|nr:unnamed protein product [Adineta steineri]